MGDVIAVFKIMPAGKDTDLDRIKDEIADLIPEGVTIEETDTEPVAFGLEALMVTIQMPDSEEISSDAMEQSFAKIEDVESVTIADVGRV